VILCSNIQPHFSPRVSDVPAACRPATIPPLHDHIRCETPCVEPTSASSAATLDDLSPNMPDPKQDMGSFRLSAQLHPAPRPNRGPITSESPPKCALVTPNPCQVPSRSFVQCLSPLSPMFGLAGASQSPHTHFPVLAYLTPTPQCAATAIFALPLTSNNSHQPPCLVQLFLPSPFRSLINTGYVRPPPPHLRIAFIYVYIDIKEKGTPRLSTFERLSTIAVTMLNI
jgi:hypothetical protein